MNLHYLYLWWHHKIYLTVFTIYDGTLKYMSQKLTLICHFTSQDLSIWWYRILCLIVVTFFMALKNFPHIITSMMVLEITAWGIYLLVAPYHLPYRICFYDGTIAPSHISYFSNDSITSTSQSLIHMTPQILPYLCCIYATTETFASH
jgi:hypothetical protein